MRLRFKPHEGILYAFVFGPGLMTIALLAEWPPAPAQWWIASVWSALLVGASFISMFERIDKEEST